MKGARPLENAEIQLITENLRIRDKALIILGIYTGFRISELISLKVGDVFQNQEMLDVVTVKRRYMKQKIESRSVPLHKDAVTPSS